MSLLASSVRSFATISTFLAACALTACTDFDTPSELQKTTVLAVVADPPLTPPGSSSRLELVVVDGTGRVAAPEASWRLVETFPGVAPMGQVTGNGDGTATYTAPAEAPPFDEKMPPIDSVEIEVAAMPKPLTVIKGMVVADVASANPTVSSLMVSGQPAMDGAIAFAGTTTLASVEISPAADEDATYAWYTTLGELEEYQSSTAMLVVPPEPGSGWLFVVVRDGKGGVAWHGTTLTSQ